MSPSERLKAHPALYGRQIGKTSTAVHLCVSVTRMRNVQIAWHSSGLGLCDTFPEEISICINGPGEEGLLSPAWVVCHSAVD